ncbi:MAG: 3-deoxy-manno-octulosonate cytidylyltransferase [candidate division Zixibacteria bacterium]|nr:3-deoxy-manno-octulosonate cytidylyltransferase [candidate division Zixibacteria bacterium]NIT51379.1 3-deoxy-manno-octulosonate cytidylyltransferase [candidate division Zixibacteria bacterium]NIW39192.1 3-deoxy-manno-octulosonate cytidylyltransferase [candidate division Zixibacteria bacterium]NIX55844.1 3-deoxy-manno-octulosonate cytidylyltransferase [candidate division Zixibacteria bacterium]
MKIIAIIPARMAATRFPGKPLARIFGLPMIEHVRRRVNLCDLLDEVIVATCDEEIREVVEKAGGKVVMTADSHERCTDRVAEAATSINADVVINIQGDEPLVLPEMIVDVARPIKNDSETVAVNLVTRIVDDEEFNNPNAPKVVTNRFGDLLYISREPIPSIKKANSKDYIKLKQLGIIAFRSDFLQTFTKLEPTPLEQIESVDMMRAVEHGYQIRMVETKGLMIGVDLPEDVSRVEAALASDSLIDKYM